MSTTMPARSRSARRECPMFAIGVDLTDGSQDAGELAALIAPIRSQQQPGAWRSLVGYRCHETPDPSVDDLQLEASG